MDDFGTVLLVGLGVLVAVGLVLTAVALVVIRRYELPVRGIVATLASLAYVVSPVDAVPEIPLGPIGLVDDLLVIIGAVVYVHGLVQARRGGPGHASGLARDLPPPARWPRLSRGQRGRR
ncbi:DUF1232 domain-containing protein [Frankia sp. AiPs1]|uniref:YkvA family protein n=1 Tax=Frankia sp. AiPa1 TaxID=573492 RepID=UPI00202AFCD1|nr:YkvA family protein [Frankia sp. AiPa1]MCL9762850.1 YkvA family protein [Frankia sp. AiPa1]